MKVHNFHSNILFFFFSLTPMISAYEGSVATRILDYGAATGRGCLEIAGRATGHFKNAACCAFNQSADVLRHPDMIKLQAIGVVSGATYGLVKALWNRINLYAVQERLAIEEVPLFWEYVLGILGKAGYYEDGPRYLMHFDRTLSNWRMYEFPTALSIKQNAAGVVQRLRADWSNIEVAHDAGVAWNINVNNSIDIEIDRLENELRRLRTYVKRPGLLPDFVSIYNSFDESCENSRHAASYINTPFGRHKKAVGEGFYNNELNLGQENTLNNEMRNTLKTTLKHWLFLRPNFGKAASIYWEIIKRIQRLQAIKLVVSNNNRVNNNVQHPIYVPARNNRQNNNAVIQVNQT